MKHGLFTLTFISAILAACNEPGTAQNPAAPPDSNPGVILQGDLCYPGRDGATLCLGAQSAKTAASQSRDYQYSNPKWNPAFPGGLDPIQYRKPDRLAVLHEASQFSHLSPFFKTSELMSSRKGGYGIFSRSALGHLESIRQILSTPLVINSAYRSPGYNREIDGSAQWSRHQYGDGVDFAAPGRPLEELARLCRTEGGIALTYKTHIHCDWRNEALDEGFYPAVESPIESEDTHQLNEEVVRTLSATLQINGIPQAPQVGEILQLSYDFPASEDEGELETNWRVKLPDGSVLSFSDSQISLPLEAAGPYRITLSAGSALIKLESFNVE